MVQYHLEVITMETVVGTIVVGVATGWALNWSYRYWNLRQKRRKKRVSCKKALDDLLQKLENDQTVQAGVQNRDEISSWTLDELVHKLQSGDVKAVDVLAAYQSSALKAHARTNCLTERIAEAEAQARECDLSSDKKGLLHGVPISIKDSYGIKGYDCTAGCSVNLDQPYAEDCVLVKVLKKQGAIPFVKTNVPTTMISWETSNNIYGATVHPYDLERGVGGSSGGEGALLASKGSVIGMGSDVGGSLRIPATLCGLCTLKPTAGRLSMLGMFTFKSLQNIVLVCPGPMGRDVDSVVTVMRALLVPYMFELDPLVPPLPFNNEVFKSKRPLKIGFYAQDGFFQAVPACERAVHLAKAALEKMGHEVVPVTLPESVLTLASYWGKSIFGDKGRMLYDLIRHEPLNSSFSMVYTFLFLGGFFSKLLAAVIKPFMPRIALQTTLICGCRSVSEWWDMAHDVKLQREKIASQWKEEGLDAMICPGFACPALRLHAASNAIGAGSYTMIFNVLDMPAGSVPVTKVSAQDVEDMKTYPSRDIWDWTIRREMKGSEGLPVGVQVVTLPWQEELCLRVMKELETALKL